MPLNTLRLAVRLSAAALLAAVARAAPSLEPRTARAVTLDSGVLLNVETGHLAVPEDRANPDSRQIRLAYARLNRRVPDAEPPALQPPLSSTPIIYLTGGPGAPCVSLANSTQALTVWNEFLDLSEVVLLDQRGAGDSQPRVAALVNLPLPEDFYLSHASAAEHQRAVARLALEQCAGGATDPRFYNTEASADDVNDLRAALGVESVRLLAFSYGTHLALSTIRRHGDHIDSAVLIGVEGPEQTLKLPSQFDVEIERLAALAATDPALEGRVPDLAALLRRLLTRLEKAPISTNLPGPTGPSPYRIGAFGLRLVVRSLLSDPRTARDLPRLLVRLEDGDIAPLREALIPVHRRFLGPVNVMGRAMDLASWAYPARIAQIERESPDSLLAEATNFPLLETRDAWGVPPLDDAFRSPIASAVRTLAISGSLDGKTPPSNASQALALFPNATLLVIENAAHGDAFFTNPEARALIHRFFAGEDVAGVNIVHPPPVFAPPGP